MMRLLMAAAALAVAPACARADDFSDRQTAFQALSAVDVAQTCYALESRRGRELNPIVGGKPSCAKVAAFKLVMVGLHELAARAIYDRDPDGARLFQVATIVIQGGVLAANFRIVF